MTPANSNPNILFSELRHINERIESHSNRFDRVHVDHEDRIRILEDFRARALGMLAVASASGGIVGGVATALILKAFHA